MTLNISQLQERLVVQFPDVELLTGSVIRFTKKLAGQPYAVYYLDFAEDLPTSKGMLTKYQDRVIGSHYFEGRKSLQWSNYLYFVTSRERLATREVLEAKEIIERDRSYARKFVIPEEEIDLVLAPPVVIPATEKPHTGILAVWTEFLIDAGLDKAILSDDDLPTRLRLIEEFSEETAVRQKAPRLDARAKNEPFVRELKLENYRRYPLRHNYSFGKVNLIYGSNGSGKTSLLEAIELLYCGRTKRNPETRQSYKVEVAYSDGRTEIGTDKRELQIFRDRNLLWYGQPEVRTNNLYQSFAQFNFLDTDAAVDLADSSARIEDDLSKLLVGSEASKVWRNIERVTEDVAKKLNGLRPLVATMKEEQASLEKRLRESSPIQQESDSIRTRLDVIVQRLGWRPENPDTELVESLSEVLSLVRQATAINWVGSPVSMARLSTYCHDAKISGKKADDGFAEIEALQRENKPLTDAINAAGAAKNLLKKAIGFIESDLPGRVSERDKQQTNIARYSAWLAGVESAALDSLSDTYQHVAVQRLCGITNEKRIAAEASVDEVKKEYMKFSTLRDQSLNLAQQLREVAAKVIDISESPDECPLCHTHFQPGELVRHINVGVDDHLETLGQAYLTQLRQREATLENAKTVEAIAIWLEKFCGRASLGGDVAVDAAVAEVGNTRRMLAEAHIRLEALSNEVLMLKTQGFSMAELEAISARLRELGYPLSAYSLEIANQLFSTIEQAILGSSRKLDALRSETDDLQKILRITLGSPEQESLDLRTALSQLRERTAATESIRAKLVHFSSYFPWPEERPLAELLIEAETVRNIAAELTATLVREKQLAIGQAESLKRKKHIKERLAEITPRVDRLAKAHSDLKSLQVQHSLNGAMEAALQENRVGIETIFSQIHSPAEFSGLGSNWTTLIRKMDGGEAKLTQISTGQRAAFALSIFLAQNAQLKNAPPVILIDDPIAHVDDMNSLSFFDYLREVALGGQRQIFFATANDKLATLFERKFDFLGEEFRKFNLSRHPDSVHVN